MKKAIGILTLMAGALFAGCKSFDAQKMDETLETLNKHGVVYTGTLEGPTEAGFELYSGGRITTGGWLSLRITSPVQNPLGKESNGSSETTD